ncbi:uncharacterized protein [Antedon mediterranea]|uniref:uncharacterized protein n=1 Tax=Antedon mediterranea TaxID=105859 RepID=UPI003AF6689B
MIIFSLQNGNTALYEYMRSNEPKLEVVNYRTKQGALNKASRIGTECGISEEAIIVAITYMNDIGKIMYSNKDEKLRNTVITNLHTMIQMLTTVITVFPPAIKEMEMKRRWKRLKDEGILEEKVLRYLWQNQDEGNFEIFVEVMRVFRLLFEKKTKEEGNREFLVPCRMTVDNETSLQVTKDDRQRVSIYLTPTDFLPDAVYHTLVVAFLELVTETGSVDQNVFRNRSDFEFKDHTVSLGAVEINRKKEKPHALKLEIYRRTIDRYNTETDGTKPKVISERRQLKPDVCFEVLNYLKDQLETVCNIYEGSGYNLRVVCDACNPKNHHLVDLEKCLRNDSVPCGRHSAMSTAHIKRLFLKESEPEADQAKQLVPETKPKSTLSLVPRENEEHEPVLEVVQVRVITRTSRQREEILKLKMIYCLQLYNLKLLALAKRWKKAQTDKPKNEEEDEDDQ